MSWAMVWTPTARARLAVLLAGADSAIILSVARLNAVLENCPRSVGESREPGERVAFDGPVGINYELDETARQVRVTDVRRTDHWAAGGGADEADDGT